MLGSVLSAFVFALRMSQSSMKVLAPNAKFGALEVVDGKVDPNRASFSSTHLCAGVIAMRAHEQSDRRDVRVRLEQLGVQLWFVLAGQ